MKKVSLLFMTFIIFAWSILSGFTVPENPQDYANDFAGILSGQTKQYVNQAARKVKELTSAEIAVVTIDSLDGEDIETYSLQLARQWQIGDASKNNGILFLVSTGDRKTYIQVGDGLEGALNDAKVGRIIDKYAIPYFKEDNWDEGIVNVVAAISKEIYNEYNVDYDDETISNLEPLGSTSVNIWEIVVFVVFAIVISLGSVFTRRRRRRNGFDPFDDDENRGLFWGFGGGSGSSGSGGFSFGGGSFSGGGAGRSF